VVILPQVGYFAGWKLGNIFLASPMLIEHDWAVSMLGRRFFEDSVQSDIVAWIIVTAVWVGISVILWLMIRWLWLSLLRQRDLANQRGG
jgi:hypothetical protein